MTSPPSGLVLWLTGPPASGKSTLARVLDQRLSGLGLDVEILDSDSLRSVLTPRATYSAEERDWFYGVLVYLARLLSEHGVTVLVAATAHRRAYRESARCSLPRFWEVHVDCPLEVCRARDPKGLYGRAREGSVTGLPGEQEPYEEPLSPEARVDTSELSADAAADALLERLESSGLLDRPHRPHRLMTSSLADLQAVG